METKSAEDIYLDLLRIDSHAKQIKQIMPESGVVIHIEVKDRLPLLYLFNDKGISYEREGHLIEACFENTVIVIR
jgi:hypothetical protein